MFMHAHALRVRVGQAYNREIGRREGLIDSYSACINHDGTFTVRYEIISTSLPHVQV